MIAIILGSLALLAALVGIGFTFSERKRNQKRNIAQLKYTETAVKNVADKFAERITKLENGTIPDYEKAKEAAKAVNDFNAGITGILGFDPYAALQAQRDKDRGGE